MAWHNPPVPWSELERRMSGRHPLDNPEGDSAPGFSRRRAHYEPPPVQPPSGNTIPYAELHVHSNFSFLDGASDPETLVEEAVRLGLRALAVTDHDGLYSVALFAEAATAFDLQTVYGA